MQQHIGRVGAREVRPPVRQVVAQLGDDGDHAVERLVDVPRKSSVEIMRPAWQLAATADGRPHAVVVPAIRAVADGIGEREVGVRPEAGPRRPARCRPRRRGRVPRFPEPRHRPRRVRPGRGTGVPASGAAGASPPSSGGALGLLGQRLGHEVEHRARPAHSGGRKLVADRHVVLGRIRGDAGVIGHLGGAGQRLGVGRLGRLGLGGAGGAGASGPGTGASVVGGAGVVVGGGACVVGGAGAWVVGGVGRGAGGGGRRGPGCRPGRGRRRCGAGPGLGHAGAGPPTGRRTGRPRS